MTYLTKDVNPILAKLSLNFSGGLVNLGLTSMENRSHTSAV